MKWDKDVALAILIFLGAWGVLLLMLILTAP